MKIIMAWLFYGYLLYLFVPLLWDHGDLLLGGVVIALLSMAFKPDPDSA